MLNQELQELSLKLNELEDSLSTVDPIYLKDRVLVSYTRSILNKLKAILPQKATVDVDEKN